MRLLKRFLLPIIAVGLVGVLSSAIVAVDDPGERTLLSKSQIREKFERRRKTEQYRNQTNREWVQQQAVTEPMSALRPAFDTPQTRDTQPPRSSSSSGTVPPPPSPGQEIALTSYDFQASGSQGHSVARNGGDGANIHFTWTAFDYIPGSIYDLNGRVVRYARYVDPENYPAMNLGAGTGYNGMNVTCESFCLGGYSDIDVDVFNHAQVGLHQIEGQWWDTYRPWHLQFPFGDDVLQIFSLTGGDNSCPSHGGEFGGRKWPRLTADRSSEELHLIAHSNIEDCPQHRLWYWRFDGITTWSGPGFIDNTDDINYALAVDATSTKVAVAVHGTEGGRSNIFYLESLIDGDDWLTSTAPLPRTAITNYTDPNGPQAWLHLTATYDNSMPGALHVMWDEQQRDGSEHVAIKHWNSTRGTIRTATIANWDNPVSPGLFNLNLSKLSMGIGDGSTMCQGGAQSNNNYVYCIYTQFGGRTTTELEDHSSEDSYEGRNGGYMNGEIFLVASTTGGNTWSVPQNLTNTKTPECDPPICTGGPCFPENECRSEHWETINRVVKDIDICFISDMDAGSIIHGEGSWELNPVHYLQLPGGTTDAPFVCPIIAPVFEASLSSDPDCEYHADRIGSTIATLTIMNLGNATLGGVISAVDFPGAPSLTVPVTGNYAITAGAPDITQTVTMNANGASEGLYLGQITISHNGTDPNNPSPRVLPIEFFVYDQFWCGQGGGTGACEPLQNATCICKYDPVCDGVISDVLDVVITVNAAFRNYQNVFDPLCSIARTDVDCNGVTDVVDVVKVIGVAFRNASPFEPNWYCDPCGLPIGAAPAVAQESFKSHESMAPRSPEDWCGTEPLWQERKAVLKSEGVILGTCYNGSCDEPAVRDATVIDTTVIDVLVHVITDGLGDGGVPQSTVAATIAQLNRDYADNCVAIQFCLKGLQYHNNPDLASVSAEQNQFFADVASIKSLYADAPTEQCNLYISAQDTPGSILGVATFPWDPNATTAQGGLWLNSIAIGTDQHTAAHEMGHCLGLWHTFHGVAEVTDCNDPCYEFASGFEGDTRGDLSSDTPPTPRNYTCFPVINADCEGVYWGETQLENFMGYAPDGCLRRFTPQQIKRQQCWRASELPNW